MPEPIATDLDNSWVQHARYLLVAHLNPKLEIDWLPRCQSSVAQAPRAAMSSPVVADETTREALTTALLGTKL
eukprot:CAMPEP_0117686366 /NCGR_PEP_ID=MMETSP0804-20121206/22399_1 /TAXON_ID=1074897 /ORGANISM="Tetraselmis astigmatica, Strain CCMP880" /LENGTH=72 /DNA_ID=CAMNT_0005498029 /DNA_START=148 /DNA_END=366 /DNA_ORIENTATION=-